MEENINNYNGRYGQQGGYQQYNQESDIDIMEYVRKLLKDWKFIAKWCAVAAVVGVVVALSAVSTYTVTSKMAPEVSGKSSGSSLSSLASLAGINLGSISTSDAISPELYPDIVSSAQFLTELFNMPVKAVYKRDSIECNYYEYLVNCQAKTWYGPIISFPGKALGWCFSIFGPKEEKLPKGFKSLGPVDPSNLTKIQEKVVEGMRKNISVTVDKKTYTITLTVTDQTPLIAAQLSQTIIDNLVEHITIYRTEKARKDLTYYEQLYDEAQSDYFDAQQKYAVYVDANQGLVRQSVMTEKERLQNEMNLKYQLYNSCAQQVQMSKAQVQRETPVCATILPPTVPSKDNESGAKTLAIFIFLGLCISCVWVIWGREWIVKLKEEIKSESGSDEKAS